MRVGGRRSIFQARAGFVKPREKSRYSHLLSGVFSSRKTSKYAWSMYSGNFPPRAVLAESQRRLRRQGETSIREAPLRLRDFRLRRLASDALPSLATAAGLWRHGCHDDGERGKSSERRFTCPGAGDVMPSGDHRETAFWGMFCGVSDENTLHPLEKVKIPPSPRPGSGQDRRWVLGCAYSTI